MKASVIDRHDPAARPAHRLEDEDDQADAEGDVPGVRRGVAVGEVVAAEDRVDDDRDRQRRRQPVPPHDAMAKAPRDREDQEAEEEDEGDVDRPQHLRRHDRVGAVEMERRHHEGGQADEAAEPALQLVGRAFLRLDVLLGAEQRLLR